jgi:purine-binding chemotaxis protein CheW
MPLSSVDIDRTGTTRAQFVVFRLDRHRYALPLAVVDRVVHAVEVTPLPKAPDVVLGVINVHGRVFPVLDVRKRFLLPGRQIGPADWFLLARAGRRTVVLAVDESEGVIERSHDDVLDASAIAPNLESFPGVLRMEDGLVLIHDLERFLSLDDARALDDAMGGIPDA